MEETNKDKKSKNNKKIVLIIIAVLGILCTLCIGVVAVVTYLGIQEEQRKEDAKSIYQKVGVVEYEILYGEEGYNRDLEQLELENVNIYYKENEEAYKNYLEGFLTSQYIDERFSESGDINIIVDSAFLIADLDTKFDGDYEVEELGDIMVSGNYIYIGQEGIPIFRDSRSFYKHMFASMLYVDLFNNFKETSLESYYENEELYNINDLDLLKDYAEIVGIESEISESDSVESSDSVSYTYPNQDILNDYLSESDICNASASPIRVVLCESVIYQTPERSMIPENASEFIVKELNLDQIGESKSLNAYPRGNSEKYPQATGLTKSPFDFDSFDNGKFTESKYVEISDSVSYYKVSNAQLQSLRLDIESDGWTYVRKASESAHNDFSANQYNLVYEKQSYGLKSQLLVRVMNTAGLSSDCIVQGFTVFCNDDSIYKGSGLIVEVLVGEYSKLPSGDSSEEDIDSEEVVE